MTNHAGDLYATPREIQSLNDCYFYHTIDLPGYGTVEGEFDFRDRPGEYLGDIEFAKKRVFEIGSANGFFTFFMERQGAEVVGFDLAEEDSWDVVPYSQYDYQSFIAERRRHIERLKNAFWLAHSLFQSHARMVYGNAYKIPVNLGRFDVCTLGCVLQHVRDPFSVLENAVRAVKDTVVVTELLPAGPTSPLERQLKSVTAHILGKKFLAKTAGLSHAHQPFLEFVPDPNGSFLKETWWYIWPETVKRFLEVLGFENTQTTYYQKKYQGKPSHLYTVVGHRTRALSS
jgi:2-polyprenyl-3-methyl-5-hydroxy-6-metoxy-1,4-benzoquinol methylase